MVGPFQRMQLDDTDFLCVSSFNHSFAVLSWLPPEDLEHHWRRLGLTGTVVSRHQIAQASVAPERRIYHFQLLADSRVEQIIAELTELLNDRSVKTVSIDMIGKKRANEKQYENGSGESVASTRTSDTAPELAHPVVSSQATPVSAPDPQSVDREPVRKQGLDRVNGKQVIVEPDEEPEWEHLEQLVDDFDSLDL